MTFGDLADPRTSQVVLIGAARYEHLTPLPAVARNVADLAAVFGDPELWGIPADRCHVVLDDPLPAEVGRVVRNAAAEVGVDGLLLIYYAGHGLIDPADGSLILALPNCEPEVPHEAGLPYEWVRRALLASTATRRVVIIDCCYAGRASPDMAATITAADVVADRAEIDRTCLLVSASANRPAAAPEGATYTAFTGELLAVLREGLPDGGPHLTMSAIWRRLRDVLANSGFERPELRERNAGGSIPLVRNIAMRQEELSGSIVAADRTVADADLAQASILVLRHDATGAVGVRLNGLHTPLPDDFTPGWRERISEPAVVRDGGPVARDGFIALAQLRPGAEPPLRFTPIRGRVGVLSLAMAPESVQHTFAWIRVYSGYFGWASGELESYLESGALMRSATDLSGRS
jgi:putative transcriptional regulator